MSAPARLDPLYEDTLLIEQARRGDQDAFATLFHRHYTMIHAFAHRLCGTDAEAQDIAQETFIRAARALGGFASTRDGTGNFRAWLYRIAVNVGRDAQRRKRRRTLLQAELAWQHTLPVRSGDDGADAVRTALAALPEEWRQALVLVFYEGMNHAQTAAVLGCAEATVSWRIFRAKRRLRELLCRNAS